MTTNTYIAKMRGVENGGLDITNAELQSAIKRINDRLYQLSSRELQDSAAYKSYESMIKNAGGTITYGKTGRPSIKFAVNSTKLGQEVRRELLSIDRHGGTYGREKDSAMAYLKERHHNENYKPTESELRRTIIKLGRIHEFIEENSGIIYAVEKEKGDFITGNDGRLSAVDVDRLFKIQREYDAIQEEKKNKAKVMSDKAKNNAENLQALNWLKDNSRLW